ncbi:MAG: helix-turn-helix domain-containing protein [Longimicrobiales bacterium]
MQALRTLAAPGFTVSEALYQPAQEIPAQPHAWATLCLTVDGGYEVDWLRKRLRCGPAALVFHPPGQVYGARVSDAGSHCLTVGIDPAALPMAASDPLDLERLSVARRAPPRWLAYQLRLELQLRDDLSIMAVESIVFALLAEVSERPGLEALSPPPQWLERVREQIEDEFRHAHTLDSLARGAGVHRIHVAREFRRRFGCTIGHYIRQRRVEFACHRLTTSEDPLSEIAFDAGFADQSHFTNTFRSLVGTTPGRFRARLRTPAPRMRAGPRSSRAAFPR